MSFMSKHQQRIEQDEKELEELMTQTPVPEEGQEPETKEEEEILSDEEKTFKKRYGDLRRHSQKQAQELKDLAARIEELESRKPTTEEPAELPTNLKEMQEWKEKYPSVARIIETMIEQEADKKFKEANISLEEIKNSQKEGEKEKAYKVILKSHPDFDDLQGMDEFHDWAEEQPRWVQVALYEQQEDPKAVIRAIDLYKMDVEKAKKPAQEKEDKKKTAGFVDTKGERAKVGDDDASGKIKESWVKKLSMKDYEKYEEKIMEAMKTGNFVYDLTGGAR
jgi:hypothetical protein